MNLQLRTQTGARPQASRIGEELICPMAPCGACAGRIYIVRLAELIAGVVAWHFKICDFVVTPSSSVHLNEIALVECLLPFSFHQISSRSFDEFIYTASNSIKEKPVKFRFGWVRLNRYEPDGGSERFGSCAVRFAVPTGSAFHAGPGMRGSTGFGTFGA